MNALSPACFATSLSSLSREPHSLSASITFVLGAGFSNSWDARYPISDSLFDLGGDDWARYSPLLAEFLSMIGFAAAAPKLDRALFLDIVYQVGMLRKYPPIRNRFVDDYCLDAIEKELRYLVYRKFIECAPPPVFDNGRFTLRPTAGDQEAIVSLFTSVMQSIYAPAGTGPPSNAQFNFVTTNYDFLIEALVDSSAPTPSAPSRHLYRGFTPRAWCGENALVPGQFRPRGNLLKINGGFELLLSSRGIEVDYRLRDVLLVQEHPPQIMLPSRAQDYDQPYFQGLFPKAVRLLRESSIVVLVGYGFPDEDALLRLLLRQFAEAPTDGRQRVLHYVDLASEAMQLERATRVFPHVGQDGGLAVMPYKGSFGQWCREVITALKST